MHLKKFIVPFQAEIDGKNLEFEIDISEELDEELIC